MIDCNFLASFLSMYCKNSLLFKKLINKDVVIIVIVILLLLLLYIIISIVIVIITIISAAGSRNDPHFNCDISVS